jgi:hypothetical protein
MNDTLPERNPITHRTHRKEVFWQITFPLIIGISVIIGLAAWTIQATATGGDISQTANASLVFLILPIMLMAIIPLVLFAGMAYGVIWLNNKLPANMRRLQDAIIRVRDGVKTGADKLVEPIIRLRSTIASLGAFKRK